MPAFILFGASLAQSLLTVGFFGTARWLLSLVSSSSKNVAALFFTTELKGMDCC